MSSNVFKLKRLSEEGLKELQAGLVAEFTGDAEIICNNLEQKEDTEVLLLVLERYYFRNHSMASLTVQCVRNGSEQLATVVAAAGGSGLLNMSMGTNNDLARMGKEILAKYGFAEVTD